MHLLPIRFNISELGLSLFTVFLCMSYQTGPVSDYNSVYISLVFWCYQSVFFIMKTVVFLCFYLCSLFIDSFIVVVVSSTFLSICKRRPSKKTNKTFWRDGKAFSKWWDAFVCLDFVFPTLTHHRFTQWAAAADSQSYTIMALLCISATALCIDNECGLFVAECGSSKQRQRLRGFCATGEFLLS